MASVKRLVKTAYGATQKCFPQAETVNYQHDLLGIVKSTYLLSSCISILQQPWSCCPLALRLWWERSYVLLQVRPQSRSVLCIECGSDHRKHHV